jgi:hypothetical protein
MIFKWNPFENSKIMEDKTDYILTELDEVKDMMMDNMSQVKNHVVQMEELNEKAENIRELSETLGKKSRILKVKECWRDYREKFIAGGIILIVLSILVIFMSISISNQVNKN